MIKLPTGYPVQSPHVAVANRHAEIMIRIGSEFGFTPATRSRIAAPALSEPMRFDSLEAKAEHEEGVRPGPWRDRRRNSDAAAICGRARKSGSSSESNSPWREAGAQLEFSSPPRSATWGRNANASSRSFFPRRERLLLHRIYVEDIDLRWVSPREEVKEDKVLDLCVQHIDECRPFFIGILECGGRVTSCRGRLHRFHTSQQAIKTGVTGQTLGLIETLLPPALGVLKIRYHGDLHLGQILLAKDDAYIAGFQGETRVSPEEPRKTRRPRTWLD
jgi:hypothetical protein